MRRTQTVASLAIAVLFLSEPGLCGPYVGDFDSTLPSREYAPPSGQFVYPTKVDDPFGASKNKWFLPSSPSGTAKNENVSEKKEQESEESCDWAMWHHGVDQAILVRFWALEERAFSEPKTYSCRVAFSVNREKQIVNIRVLKQSENRVFNSVVVLLLKSMNGQQILEFPSDSTKQLVEKEITFTSTGKERAERAKKFNAVPAQSGNSDKQN